MNIAQAKQIALETVLQAMKAEETKATPDRSEIWYKSPIAEEKTASFKIDTKKNLWYDHGRGIGGDIIKLVQERNRCTVSEALQWLKCVSGRVTPEKVIQPTTSQPAASKEPSGRQFVLLEEKEIGNKALIRYMAGRGIPHGLLANHCKEIYFKSTRSNKNLYGIGFQNDSEGWEIRGAIGNFKAIIEPHDLTTIYSQKPCRTLDVLEGFTDYLTKEQKWPQQPHQATIVLNSAALAKRAIQKILTDPKFATIELIRLWFDNDKRGEEITQEFLMALHRKCNVGDARPLYEGPNENGEKYKDINKWWTDCPEARQGKPEMKFSTDAVNPMPRDSIAYKLKYGINS